MNEIPSFKEHETNCLHQATHSQQSQILVLRPIQFVDWQNRQQCRQNDDTKSSRTVETKLLDGDEFREQCGGSQRAKRAEKIKPVGNVKLTVPRGKGKQNTRGQFEAKQECASKPGRKNREDSPLSETDVKSQKATTPKQQNQCSEKNILQNSPTQRQGCHHRQALHQVNCPAMENSTSKGVLPDIKKFTLGLCKSVLSIFQSKAENVDLSQKEEVVTAPLPEASEKEETGSPIQGPCQTFESSSTNQQPEFQKLGKDSKSTTEIKFENFSFLRRLGTGQFGCVYLVANDDNYYALKCVSKSFIIEQKLERHLQQEKLVMQKLQFPFIVRFIRSFKTPEHVFFLLEYVEGLEMFELIRKVGLLQSEISRFYIASLVLCLQYLESHNIIYRDLKPENVMVDAEGFVKLIDLGTCKIMNGPLDRTYTIIGTPHYMAPEILEGKGYTSLVDLWSLGVCLFEFMCGRLPFGEQFQDPYEIYNEITSGELRFPATMQDSVAGSLIQQLLRKDPLLRQEGSYSKLKLHRWFESVDWDKLIRKEMSPPYKPTSQPTPEEKSTRLPSAQEFLSELPKMVKRTSGRKNFDADWDSIF